MNCKSSFYSVDDVLNSQEFEFKKGSNILQGEIDSGIFAITYIIAMYKKTNKKTLFLPLVAEVDGVNIELSELSKTACYMDMTNPLFSSRKSVVCLINKGLKKSKLPYTAKEILEGFFISDFKYKMPVRACGNEKIRIMAAIGYAWGKEIFCFPWYSKHRYENAFGENISFSTEKLSELGKIVICPIGK